MEERLYSDYKTHLDKLIQRTLFSYPFYDKTDEELIKHLENQNFNSNLLIQIQKILEGALWVKFANQEALKIQAESDLKTIIQIIEQTKPIEQK